MKPKNEFQTKLFFLPEEKAVLGLWKMNLSMFVHDHIQATKRNLKLGWTKWTCHQLKADYTFLMSIVPLVDKVVRQVQCI